MLLTQDQNAYEKLCIENYDVDQNVNCGAGGLCTRNVTFLTLKNLYTVHSSKQLYTVFTITVQYR